MILFAFSSSSWFYSSYSPSKHQKNNEIQTDLQIVYDHRRNGFLSLLPTSNFCSQNHGLHGSLTGLLWLPYAMPSCHHVAWKLASRQNACASRGPALSNAGSWIPKGKWMLQKLGWHQCNAILYTCSNSILNICWWNMLCLFVRTSILIHNAYKYICRYRITI